MPISKGLLDECIEKDLVFYWYVLAGGIPKGVDVEGIGSINGVSIYEFDLDTVEDKPWRRPGIREMENQYVFN